METGLKPANFGPSNTRKLIGFFQNRKFYWACGVLGFFALCAAYIQFASHSLCTHLELT
ncbi:hypothetical protein GALMADRAFT_233180 [Galerina marginata CBS 339.88]|uniref:Uncharacterized protein n=1 Tax=Galerina marginata (strain CBS 339.88) TaxID=685588 RepID=A0A067TNP5_GALM3|nr:hypothetical protein GALMADRAFT_233180 [Galerina marginata CBS 339.88]